MEAFIMEAPIRAEPLACYSPYTQTYYIPPPPPEQVPLSFYDFLFHMPYQPPSTNMPSVINIPPHPQRHMSTIGSHTTLRRGQVNLI
jgi:hypothetical protein